VLQRLASLLLIGLTVAPALGQDADLKWDFKKDKPFYQTMSTSTKQDLKVADMTQNQTQEQTFWFQWTPTKVEKDSAELKMKILGLKVEMKIGENRVSFDSTTPGNPGGANPLANFFKAIVGAEFTVTLDRIKMEVTKIEGQKAFVGKLGNANPQMKPLLDQILSEKALKEMIESMFAALPGKKVKKGENWTRKTELEMGGFGKYETTSIYTYDGQVDQGKEKLDKISVKTSLKYTPPGEKEGAGLPFKIKDAKLEIKESDSTGTLFYNPKTGWIQSSDLTVKLTGNLTIDINQQSNAVDINQTQKSILKTSAENPIKETK
jgi:Family of unknown function (DUF6263)